jgi:hypothetical protein
MKKSLLVLFAALSLVVLISAVSFDSNFFKTKVFTFDNTTTAVQLEELQADMLKSGIKMEIKSLAYNPEGLIDRIEVYLKYTGGTSRFCTENFESAHIEKRMFGMRLVVK